MIQKYSQLTALKAITKASFLANLKNPQSLVFSLIFPLVFVFIFGAFNGRGLNHFTIANAPNSDTTNPIYKTIADQPFIKVKYYNDTSLMRQDLERGKLTGIVLLKTIPTPNDTILAQHYSLNIQSTSASAIEMAQLIPLLENITDKLEKKMEGNRPNLVTINQDIYNVREYKQIDFVLPGQIGFSLLFSTLFGIAFTFFNLREQLVLKRFYATPVNRMNILIGIGFSRIFFQLINVLVLIIVGHFFIGFTLAHGFITFIEMVSLSILFLFLLMGIGLILSSIVKNDTMIPLYINIITLPQMLLSGTFFSVSVFPEWLQNACKIFPLTHFNMAMRKISFEGVSIWDCWQHIGVLALWSLLVYSIVWKVFKWDK